MLKTKMYVRCPADQESMYEPRIFVCGQIINIDEFKRTVSVKVHDPFGHLLFFEDLPKGVIELPLGSVDRCSFFIGSIVVYKGSSYKVLSCQKCKDDYYKYYIQNFDDTSVVKVPEADVIAAFNNGQVDPCVQLKNYEFQNPAWYLGRAVVAKSMDILENSIYGFKELAGSKIYLMPHQVNTIMRCLQESPCRYMLADEVGMGKTIEAISVYKIYTMNQSNKKALIVVPQVLKEQWISELLLKFNIPNGMGKNNNSVTVKTLQELSEKDLFTDWDFVIVDEVHKYLFSQSEYEKLHKISTLAKNILLLSATPVQQKKEEYLDLLRLLLPQKYNSFSVEKFGKLIAKQSKIIQKTALILDDLGDFEEEINSLAESAHDSEECEELFEEIHEDLEEICDELDDDKLNELLQQIKYENDDLGVYTIKVIISYICSNYQIESNIIRNRRKILESTDEDVQLMASRDLIELTYLTDNEGKSNLVHLGKRSHEARFLKDTIKGRNIDWFKEKFGGENWEDYVLSARKYSHEKALEILKKRSNIRGAREEMERTLSARVANSEFYGLNDEGIEQLKQTQKIVLDAIKHPKIHLESVSFIMMIGERNE